MYKVIIRKGEIFLEKWNKETRKYEERKKEEQRLSNVLQFPIEIEETTFGQFFELIAADADIFERVFAGSTYGHPLGPYIDEVRKPVGDHGKVEYVEVFWHAERSDDELTFCSGFHGFGEWEPQPGVPEMPHKGGYALEFTALNEYKDLPLKLDTDATFYSMEDAGKTLMTGKLKFTVYNVLDAILGEITWSGDISKGRQTVEEFIGEKEGEKKED